MSTENTHRDSFLLYVLFCVKSFMGFADLFSSFFHAAELCSAAEPRGNKTALCGIMSSLGNQWHFHRRRIGFNVHR